MSGDRGRGRHTPSYALAFGVASLGFGVLLGCSGGGKTPDFSPPQDASGTPERDAPVSSENDGPNPQPSFVTAGPQPVPGTLAREIVGPMGGVVALGDLVLTVPAGTLESDQPIMVTVEETPPGMAVAPDYSQVYKFEPEGLTFDEPIEVRIPFSGNPEQAVVYWSTKDDPTSFEAIPATIDGAFAVAKVSHFSRGFVGYFCFLGGACACGTNADCAKHEDGNACNGTLYCDLSGAKGVCKVLPSTVVTCPTDDDWSCGKNACNPQSGQCTLVPYNENAFCDDSDKCTVGERCKSGMCTGGADKCECKKDADCKDDGDLCNGTLYCDASKSPNICLVNPATVVVCNTTEDTACRKSTCQPKTGQCGPVNQTDGTTCDDGEKCTSNDACKQGICAPGAFVCACQNDADCAAKDDGNLCNGTLFCNKAGFTCELNPATVVSCSNVNDTACTQNKCVPSTGKCGMTPVADGVTCDDGDMCTSVDVCVAGQCTGSSSTCECTEDSHCADKSKNALCAGTHYCNKQLGKCELNPATAIVCPTVDDTTCAKNTCSNATGACEMKPVANGTPCSDLDDLCTMNDTCEAGLCKGGPNLCECWNDSDCAAKEDGNLCNGTLYCDKTVGTCKVNPATVKTCPTVGNTTCSETRCVAATGQCQAFANNEQKVCDDGVATTQADQCTSGTCAGMAAMGSVYECTTASDCDQYFDGNNCRFMVCSNNRCQYGGHVTCNSSGDSECSYNACNPSSGVCGMVPRFEGSSCGGGTGICTAGGCDSL